MNPLHRQQGFTLVEVITVMLVLVAIASITVESSKDFVFQNRYEITKDRYEKIKKAIIGDSNQVINGQPNIEGFVKDMGRLPRNLHELLVQNYCMPDYRISESNPDKPSTYTTYKAWCEGEYPAATEKWIEQSNNTACSDNIQINRFSCEAAGFIWTGWKGSYIQMTQPDYKANALPDGWGNVATGINDQNYGWFVVNNTSTINIQSKGKNGCINGSVNNGITCVDSVSDVYDADYPIIQPAISANDWGVLLPTNITVTIAPVTRKIFVRPTSQTDCENSGGTWNTTTTPMCIMNSEYNETQCIANNGSWNATNKCSIIQPNITSPTVCLNFGGTWNGSSCAGAWSSYNIIQLCLNSEKLTAPLPVSSITENGLPQTVSFTVSSPSTIIPIGQTSFIVNVYDGASCNTSTTYPVDHQPQIVTISPRSTLNFNW